MYSLIAQRPTSLAQSIVNRVLSRPAGQDIGGVALLILAAAAPCLALLVILAGIKVVLMTFTSNRSAAGTGQAILHILQPNEI